MKLRQLLLATFILLGLLGLTACSTDKSPGSATMMGPGGAHASGIGGQSGFAGANMEQVKATPGKNQTFYFTFDSSQVPQKYLNALKVHANYIVKHSNVKVRLEGNTDSRGSREYNIALGWRRANAVARVLELDGVPKRQIQEVSYGEERPVALGHTESAYRLNRRVDLVYEK